MDCLVRPAIRITCSIHLLMMQTRHDSQPLHIGHIQLQYLLCSCSRMLLDDREFFVRQPSRLVEDIRWHHQFSQVVQQAPHRQL